MSESTHKVEVVKVELEKHPNADALSIVRVFGYTVVVRTEDWTGRAIGAYIPPDSVVPDIEYYEFLANGPLKEDGTKELRLKDRRIKAKKLRGVWSQGMLVPVPANALIGDDVAEELGITHYEPPEPDLFIGTVGGNKILRYVDQAQSPELICGPYHLESWYRHNPFKDGEEIIITEKIHGSNFRAVYHEEELHVGSHRQWKRGNIPVIRNSRISNAWRSFANRWLGTNFLLNYERPNNDWWWFAARNYGLEHKLDWMPDFIFYGEVYGSAIQDLTYGVSGSAITFYDVRSGVTGEWLSYDDARAVVKEMGLEFVPELYRGPYSEAIVRGHTDGPSILSKTSQIREGIVIQAVKERHDANCGRVKLKAVSNVYLERA